LSPDSTDLWVIVVPESPLSFQVCDLVRKAKN
jgi:hypothetical protein